MMPPQLLTSQLRRVQSTGDGTCRDAPFTPTVMLQRQCEASHSRSHSSDTLQTRTFCPPTLRTDNAPKVRSSATLGEEPEIEVGLAKWLRARALLTEL